GERYVELDDYAGLGRRSPVLAAALTLFLLSLIGIPVTGGFFAKLYVFSAALKANLVGLVVLGVINSAVGAYYYLRLIVLMYMREGKEDQPAVRVPAGLAAGLLLSAAATLYLGVWPQQVLAYALESASALLH
ncbi:MAG TPA: proton-conducting transporter membrane subunit, partial [Terriglobales bacterium]|nr:proton-conducting transporter membrane subunit [Terriglobales bacterium]